MKQTESEHIPKIYQEALTEELLRKLPLTFRDLQQGEASSSKYLIHRVRKSNVHQTDEYELHNYHKPISKML